MFDIVVLWHFNLQKAENTCVPSDEAVSLNCQEGQRYKRLSGFYSTDKLHVFYFVKNFIYLLILGYCLLCVNSSFTWYVTTAKGVYYFLR